MLQRQEVQRPGAWSLEPECPGDQPGAAAACGQVVPLSVPQFPHLKWGDCRCPSQGTAVQGV